MPVVIGDFEIVTEESPLPNRGAAGGEAQPVEQTYGVTPHEVELIIQRETERLARVQAY